MSNKVFQRVLTGTFTIYRNLPDKQKEEIKIFLKDTAAKPLFLDGYHKPSKYFPSNFFFESLTATMLIKDEEADNELMKSVSSGELKDKLNEIISKLKPEIKIENLSLQEKEVIETNESFEKLEKKAQEAARTNPIIVPPNPLKVSCRVF